MSERIKQIIDWDNVIKECKRNIAIAEKHRKSLLIGATIEEKKEYRKVCREKEIEEGAISINLPQNL